MKKIIFLFCFLILLFGFSQAGAGYFINNLAVEKVGPATQVTIFASDSMSFSHFIEEAKDNKPFRVIVDCYEAYFELPKNNFRNLPTKNLTAIRGSQYQTSPSNIVRIVLDFTTSTAYTISQENNKVYIRFTSEEPEFSVWTADWTLYRNQSNSAPKVTQQFQADSFSITLTDTLAQTPTGSESSEVLAVVPDTINVMTTPPVSESPQESTAYSESASGGADTTQQVLEMPLVTVETTAAVPSTTSTSMTETTGTVPTAPAPTMALPDTPVIVPTDTPISQPRTPDIKPTETEPKGLPVEKISPVEKSKKEKVVPVKSKTKTFVDSAPDTSAKGEPVKLEVAPGQPLAKADTSLIKFRASFLRTFAEQAAEAFPTRKLVRYDREGRRDPFSPLGEKVEFELGKAPQPNVENLRLVGILEDFIENLALLEDNQGFGYILKAGDKIRNGYVIAVEEDRVIFQIQEYGWSRNVALDLYNDQNK